MIDKKSQARSITDRLRSLAKEAGASYENILTEFLIERLLVRLLSEKEFSKNLVFKGGYVSLRVYSSPRYTIDLDATMTKGKLANLSEKAVATVEKDCNDGAWFQYEKSVDLETQGEYGGLRLVFRAGLGEVLKNPKKGQVINFDIGTGDPVTPGPKQIETPALIGDESIRWPVYPVETTAAEKLHCLVTRSLDNSRSKDIFDLTVLLPMCKMDVLTKAIRATFSHRGDIVPSDLVEHLKQTDTSILRRGWKSATADIQPSPDFDDSFEVILKQLKKL